MENEKQLLEKVSSEATKAIEEKLNGYASTEQVTEIKGMIEKASTTDEVNAIKEVISSLELSVKALSESKVAEKKAGNPLGALLAENKDAIQSIRKDGGKYVAMEVKAFDTATNFGTWTDFIEPTIVEGVQRTPNTKLLFNILNYVSTGRTESEIVKWMEEDTETGDALFIDECVAKPDVSKTWKTNKAEVKKVADFTRICDEVLMYLPFAEAEIRAFLRDKVYVAIQEAIINGDGVGENLLGITPQASAFVAGALALSVPSANRADAIRASVSNINCLGFNANVVFVNCDDLFLLESEKDLNGQYLRGSLGGVQLVECPYIPSGSFLVGDMTRSRVAFKQDITVEMGMNEDDFRLNAVSLRGEAFLTHYIPSNAVNAFVFDTFANVILAIDKP